MIISSTIAGAEQTMASPGLGGLLASQPVSSGTGNRHVGDAADRYLIRFSADPAESK
jgi:hypothetical protein